MTIVLSTKISPFKSSPDALNSLIQNLMEMDYKPLFLQAKQRFLEVFGESQLEIVELADVCREKPHGYREDQLWDYEHELRRRYGYRYRGDLPIPVFGDLFFSEGGKGFLYLALVATDRIRPRPYRGKGVWCLEAGYVGDETDSGSFESFMTSMAEVLTTLNIPTEWFDYPPPIWQSEDWADRRSRTFLPATDVPKDHLELAKHLEDQSTRSLALEVRQSGGMLLADLLRKAEGDLEEVQGVIEHLTQVGLLAKEYAIICRRTSRQTNRVNSLEAIDEMTRMGVLCSCGRPISEERVEEIVTSTPDLQQMLNQSYWMTISLLQTLKQLNVPEDYILLNLVDGSEEIDAFVDLDGTVLMFELKDGEFSMGHAYPFASRIGLYKPDFAIIVSTSRVATEVKQHFDRVKPHTDIVYVNQLDELAPKLGQIAERVRLAKALWVLSRFLPMAAVEMPLIKLLTTKLGTEIESHLNEEWTIYNR